MIDFGDDLDVVRPVVYGTRARMTEERRRKIAGIFRAAFDHGFPQAAAIGA